MSRALAITDVRAVFLTALFFVFSCLLFVVPFSVSAESEMQSMVKKAPSHGVGFGAGFDPRGFLSGEKGSTTRPWGKEISREMRIAEIERKLAMLDMERVRLIQKLEELRAGKMSTGETNASSTKKNLKKTRFHPEHRVFRYGDHDSTTGDVLGAATSASIEDIVIAIETHVSDLSFLVAEVDGGEVLGAMTDPSDGYPEDYEPINDFLAYPNDTESGEVLGASDSFEDSVTTFVSDAEMLVADIAAQIDEISNDSGEVLGASTAPGEESFELLQLRVNLLTLKIVIQQPGADTVTLQKQIEKVLAQIAAIEAEATSITSIYLHQPAKNAVFALGEVFPFSWTVENAPRHSQVEIELQRVPDNNPNGPAQELWRWQGRELRAGITLTNSKPSNVWNRGTDGFPTSMRELSKGTYRVYAFVVECHPKGCTTPRLSQGRVVSQQHADAESIVFRIGNQTSTSSITVIAPNGGEQWESGVTNTVTWKPYSYGTSDSKRDDINPPYDVTAYLEQLLGEKENGEKVFETVGKVQESGKASIHWTTGELNSATVGGKFATPGQYYIRVVNNKTGAWDRSDRAFILKQSVDLKLNDSDGPIVVKKGAAVTASWGALGMKSCEIYNAHTDTTFYTQIGEVRLSGERIVYVPNKPNHYVTLYCYQADGKVVYDSVQVNSRSESASMKVLSPNGGEKISFGKPMSVGLGYTGMSRYSAALYMNDQWVEWILKDELVEKEGFTWTPKSSLIKEALSSGNVFKIYVTGKKADGTGYVDDKSDAPFSFIEDTPVKGMGEYKIYYGTSTAAVPGIMTTKEQAIKLCRERSAVAVLKGDTVWCTWNGAVIFGKKPVVTPPPSNNPQVILDPVGATVTLDVNSGSSASDDTGTFSLKVEVTAVDSDLYISSSAARGNFAGGFNYQIENGHTGRATSSGTFIASLDSTADQEGVYYKVNKGERETFTLTVTYDPTSSALYKLQLRSVNWNEIAAPAKTKTVPSPVNDCETGTLSIPN